MRERRLKIYRLPRDFEMIHHTAFHLKNVVDHIDGLIEETKLPQDTLITWVWYDAPWGTFSLMLWSLAWGVVPEGEAPPVCS